MVWSTPWNLLRHGFVSSFPIAVFSCLATENRTQDTGHAPIPRPDQSAQDFGRYPRQRGNVVVDDYTMADALLWMCRTGAPWRDLPECFGKWITVYQRSDRLDETFLANLMLVRIAIYLKDTIRTN